MTSTATDLTVIAGVLLVAQAELFGRGKQEGTIEVNEVTVERLVDDPAITTAENKRRIKLKIEAPTTVVVRPSVKEPGKSQAIFEFCVTVVNIGSEPFEAIPLLIDVAVCEADGSELALDSWDVKDAGRGHCTSSSYHLRPGYTATRAFSMRICGKAVQPGQTYTLVANYMSMRQPKYAVAQFKTLAGPSPTPKLKTKR